MAKDKNRNFDNYVRKSFSKDPLVPEGLDWGRMDIEIPKKRKRRSLLFYFIGFAIIGAMFLSGFFVKGYLSDKDVAHEDKFANKVAESSEVTSTSDIIINGSKEESIEINTKKDIKKSGYDSNNSPILNHTKRTSFFTETHSDEVNLLDQVDQSKSSITPNNILSLQSKVPNLREVNPAISISDKNNSLNSDVSKKEFVLKSEEKVSSDMPFTISYLPRQELPTLFVNRPHLDLTSEFELDVINEIATHEVSFNLGMNIGSINSTTKIDLINKVSNVLGTSIVLGYNRRLGSNFILNTAVDYNEHHTVFQHSEEINRQNNFVDGTLLITCQHIYQNNFSKSLGLTTGIGYEFRIASNMELRTNANLSANRLMSISGLALSGDEVINLNDHGYDKSININFSPSVEFKYSLQKNFGLNISYVYSKSISNGIDLGNSVRRYSMSQFLSGVYFTF